MLWEVYQLLHLQDPLHYLEGRALDKMVFDRLSPVQLSSMGKIYSFNNDLPYSEIKSQSSN